jgi:hypothetical protein
MSRKRYTPEQIIAKLGKEADILCEGHYGVYQGKKEMAGFIRRLLALSV